MLNILLRGLVLLKACANLLKLLVFGLNQLLEGLELFAVVQPFLLLLL
jgi:hypothetical protein